TSRPSWQRSTGSRCKFIIPASASVMSISVLSMLRTRSDSSTQSARASLAAAEQVGPNHYGADRRESGEEKAKRILAEGLKQLGWDETELRARRKGDRQKIALARRLRLETTMSLKWIARHFQMGSWTNVSNLLRQPVGELDSVAGDAATQKRPR